MGVGICKVCGGEIIDSFSLGEETKYKLIFYPIMFLFAGVFCPLGTFLQPFHNNEFLTWIGIVGMFLIMFPFLIYVLWLMHKANSDPKVKSSCKEKMI